MIDFSADTAFNKTIPKTTLYGNLPITPALKNIFVKEIEKVIWRNKLSSETLNVQQGKRVQEVEVFEIVLKKSSLSEPVLRIIDKGIPYHLLFLLRHGDRYMACLGYKEAGNLSVMEYFKTSWMLFAELPLQVIGLTMDDVYDNFVRQIHQKLEAHTTGTLAEAVKAESRQRQVEQQIVRLEKLARAEKQPKRKFEMVQAIQKLEDTKEDKNGKNENAYAGRRG